MDCTRRRQSLAANSPCRPNARDSAFGYDADVRLSAAPGREARRDLHPAAGGTHGPLARKPSI